MIFKRLYIVILILFATIIAGCKYEPADDNRLLAVDSLLDNNPDSAYSILSTINANEIEGKSNKAFYSLLKTQALYKLYRSIESDSLINIALDYYYNRIVFSEDCQRLYARSLMYKGNVMRELGCQDSALYYYSRSKFYLDSLNKKDFALFAEVNYRIAWLYNDAYLPNRLYIGRFKLAGEYFGKSANKTYQLYCHEQVGSLHRRDNLDSAFKYCNSALKMAYELNRKDKIHSIKTDLVGAYYIDRQYTKAIDVAKSIVDYSPHDRGESCIYLAMAYAKLKMPDSARLYLNKVNIDRTVERYDVLYLKANDVVLYAEGKFDEAYKFFKLTETRNDSVMSAGGGNKLILAEQQLAKIIANESQERIKNQNRNNYILISMIGLILSAVVAYLIMKYRATVKSNRQYISLLKDNIELTKEELTSLQSKNKELLNILKQETNSEVNGNFTEVTTDSLLILDSYIAEIVRIMTIIETHKNISKYASSFRKLLDELQLPDGFQHNLLSFVNLKYNNLGDKLFEQFPFLYTEKYGLIVLMICSGFSSKTICFCLKFPNMNTFNVVLNRVAKRMGLNESLNKYLKRQLHDLEQ